MTRKLQIRVFFLDHETHPLTACIVDEETGAGLTEMVKHRNMSTVRSFYNGWISALSAAGLRTLTIRATEWPFKEQEYEVPVWFYPENYLIADSVPKHLRD